MGTIYTLPLKLPEAGATTIFKNITVGEKTVSLLKNSMILFSVISQPRRQVTLSM